MESIEYQACDEAATDALGTALAGLLPRPAVVALYGTLGSGKTRLVQALAAGLGIDRQIVSSPTFVLLHEYESDSPLYHFDAYRLRSVSEFWDVGADEYLADRRGITVIEWADRVAECLPAQRLEIAIEVTGATQRRFKVTAKGASYRSVVSGLKVWTKKPLG